MRHGLEEHGLGTCEQATDYDGNVHKKLTWDTLGGNQVRAVFYQNSVLSESEMHHGPTIVEIITHDQLIAGRCNMWVKAPSPDACYFADIVLGDF